MGKRALPRFSSKKLLLVMGFVILAGLSMGVVGILAVSKQRRTREEELHERLIRGLQQIRIESENRIGSMIRNVFSYPVERENIQNPEYVRELLKRILKENPVVQYPFLVGRDGVFVFPPVPGTKPAVYSLTLPDLLSGSFHRLFNRGMAEEFENRDYGAAISIYLRILNRAGLHRDRMLLTFVIARCYHKWKKYFQAVSYLKDVEQNFSQYLELNHLFRFTFLRQYAQSYKAMGDIDMMNRRYLTLYEKVLEFESATGSSQFSFFKNEALDLLNRFMSSDESKSDRFVMAKQRDRLQEASHLDISLRWKFFDTGESEPVATAVPANDDRHLFLLIQDLLAPNDRKSEFYRRLKADAPWGNLKSFEAAEHRLAVGTDEQTVLMKKTGGDLTFGFSLSGQVLTESFFRRMLERHITLPGLKINIYQPVPDDPSVLGTVFFEKYFPGKKLVLKAAAPDFIPRRVRQEMMVNYIIIGLLLVFLMMGIYLFYQYVSRESQLLRLRSDFFEGASHTLKTPLTRIRLLAEKMQLGWISDKSRREEYMGTIVRESDRMAGVIQNILDFSRIEGGENTLHPERGSLPKLVDDMIGRFKPWLDSGNMVLKTEMDRQMADFPFDPEIMSRVVSNLIQNAVKYSPGGGELMIVLRENRGCAVLEVADRGMGIDGADRGRIFDRFFRSADRRIQSIEGSGLGLFLVRHGVDAQGGSIEVLNRDGGGSLFRVSIPMTPSGKTEGAKG